MLRFSFYFLLVSLLSGIILVVALALFIVPQLPDIETLKDVRMQVPLRVYSADQSLIAEFGEQKMIVFMCIREWIGKVFSGQPFNWLKPVRKPREAAQ